MYALNVCSPAIRSITLRVTSIRVSRARGKGGRSAIFRCFVPLKTRAKKLYRTRTRIFGRLNRIRILCKINGSIASAHRSPAKKRVQDLVRVF